MNDGMDQHGMDEPGFDGPGPHHLDPDQPPGMDELGMDDSGMAGAGPDEPGLDPLDAAPADLDPADPGWPDQPGAGDLDHLTDLTGGADTVELSFVAEYGPEHHLDADHALDDDQPDQMQQLHDPVADPAFGADPDLHPLAEVEPTPQPPFPPMLDLDPPEPIDGPPWTDPAILGHEPLPALGETTGAPEPAELFEYAGRAAVRGRGSVGGAAGRRGSRHQRASPLVDGPAVTSS